MKLSLTEFIEKYTYISESTTEVDTTEISEAFRDMDDSLFSYCNIKTRNLKLYYRLKQLRKSYTKCRICGCYFEGSKKTGSCSNEYCIEQYKILIQLQTEKQQQTCLKRFGYTHNSKKPDRKEKLKQTYQERYGVDNASMLESVKQKSRETCQRKYGVTHYSKTDEYKKSYKQTCRERYGVDNVSQAEEIKDLKAQTFLKNYGVSCIFMSEEFKEAYKQTCLIDKEKAYDLGFRKTFDCGYLVFRI